MTDDYYKILGVGRNASKEDIDKQYLKLQKGKKTPKKLKKAYNDIQKELKSRNSETKKKKKQKKEAESIKKKQKKKEVTFEDLESSSHMAEPSESLTGTETTDSVTGSVTGSVTDSVTDSFLHDAANAANKKEVHVSKKAYKNGQQTSGVHEIYKNGKLVYNDNETENDNFLDYWSEINNKDIEMKNYNFLEHWWPILGLTII